MFLQQHVCKFNKQINKLYHIFLSLFFLYQWYFHLKQAAKCTSKTNSEIWCHAHKFDNAQGKLNQKPISDKPSCPLKVNTKFIHYFLKTLCKYHESKQIKVNVRFDFHKSWDNSTAKATSKLPQNFNINYIKITMITLIQRVKRSQVIFTVFDFRMSVI